MELIQQILQHVLSWRSSEMVRSGDWWWITHLLIARHGRPALPDRRRTSLTHSPLNVEMMFPVVNTNTNYNYFNVAVWHDISRIILQDYLNVKQQTEL